MQSSGGTGAAAASHGTAERLLGELVQDEPDGAGRAFWALFWRSLDVLSRDDLERVLVAVGQPHLERRLAAAGVRQPIVVSLDGRRVGGDGPSGLVGVPAPRDALSPNGR